MIAVIDYDAGNIRSVTKALEKMGGTIILTKSPEIVQKSSKIILPGVGAFGQAVDTLTQLKLMKVIRSEILKGKPFMGICLGFQLLFESSEESPDRSGLGILAGTVKRFRTELKVPHLGWNQVTQSTESLLWKGISDESYFYFAHSFYVPKEENTFSCGITDYDSPFISAVSKDNIFGVQFHPEKSQALGLKILKNFLGI